MIPVWYLSDFLLKILGDCYTYALWGTDMINICTNALIICYKCTFLLCSANCKIFKHGWWWRRVCCGQNPGQESPQWKGKQLSADTTFIMDSRWSTTSLGRALVQRRTHGSRGKTSTVQSWSKLLRTNSNRKKSRFRICCICLLYTSDAADE